MRRDAVATTRRAESVLGLGSRLEGKILTTEVAESTETEEGSGGITGSRSREEGTCKCWADKEVPSRFSPFETSAEYHESGMRSSR